MNFYDKIHELVRTFKEMEEYKTYIDLKTKIKKDERTSKELKEFKKAQQEAQLSYINTGEMKEEIQKELENKYSILIQKEEVRKFFEAEIKLDVILADMQKIIAEGIKEMIDFE
ncbi:MAG: YlbF family regulator [Clostridia bacterium]|nr:YlbF family regulator [Clostridia bacterium]MDD4375279.1 YlbF family regulator [Clostridia bacterium]